MSPNEHINPKRLRALILTFYIAMGVIFSIVFPLGEAPDEPAHFSYVRYIATTGRLPVMKPVYQDNETNEAFQAPAYYVLASLVAWPFVKQDVHLYSNPLSSWNARVPLFVSGPEHRFPQWKGTYLGWRLIRLFSLATGILGLLAIYAMGKSVFHSEWPALAAMAYVAFNPQFIYLHSYVTNDALATAAGSGLLWVALWMLERKSLRTFIVAGVLLGLAGITKPTVLTLVPGLLIAGWLTWKNIEPSRNRLVAWAIFLTIPTLSVGWWIWRNINLYGDWLGMRVARQALAANYYPTPLTLRELGEIAPQMFWRTFQTSWGYFGWITIPLPDAVFRVIAALHLIALTGLLITLWQTRKVSLPALVLAASGMGSMIGFLRYNMITNSSGWHGRFLFPCIGIAALAFVAGWRYWFRNRDRLLALFTTGAGVALSIYALVGVVLPIYLSPKFLPAGCNVPNEMDVAFDGGLHLIGYELPTTKVKAGNALGLTLYWKLDAPTTYAYRARVTAYTPHGDSVIQPVESFLMRRYPTVYWEPGKVVRERYRLLTTTEAEQMAGMLSVEVFQGRQMEPVPRLDGSGSNKVDIAQIAAGARRKRVSPDVKVDAVLGGGVVRLVGYEIEEEPIKANGAFTVTLYWRAEQDINRNYQVFVHLIDTGGTLVAQHDGTPRLGSYPTSVWSAGEIVRDAHPIVCPADYKGQANLLVGLYSLETMERLQAFDRQGAEYPHRAVPLGQFGICQR